MRLPIRWILPILLLVPSAALRAEGSDNLRYALEAVTDLENREIRVQAVITIPARLRAGDQEVDLDPHSAGSREDGEPFLRIQEVTEVPSGRTLPWTGAGEMIRVTLPAGAPAGAEVAIGVKYSVLLDEEGLEMFGYYLYTGHEPGSLWYPDVVGADGVRERFRDFRVTITYPADYGVMTTGRLEGETVADEGRKKARFAASHVEGFTLAMGKGFVLTEVAKGEERILAFSAPEVVGTYRRVAELAADTVAWYRKTYGFFPVQQIGVLQGHPRWRGGFPLPNVFMIHQGNVTEEFLQWITSHELGHYYWGLHVLGDEERLDWLQLSNGIWTTQFYMAEATGKTLDQQWQGRGTGDWYTYAIRAGLGNHEQRLGLPPEEEQALNFDYNTLVRHGKAAVGLFLQARLLGQDKYLELQRRLIEDYRYKPLPVNEFVARLEEAGLAQAGEFFEAWKRGDAAIGFDASVQSVERVTEGWRYEIEVRRTGTVKYPVVVELQDAAGNNLRRELAGRVEEETFQATLGAPLSQVVLDPEGVLPMWNSGHPAMRKQFLRALRAESLSGPLLAQAKSFLESNPEDEEVRSYLTEELFEAGRYRDVITLLQGKPWESCESREECRTAIFLARALARSGKGGQAASVLSAVEMGSRRNGLERTWLTAQKEVPAAPAR